MKKVRIIGGDWSVEKMFRQHGWSIVGEGSTPDLAVFTGGADVQPHLYQEHNVASYVSAWRDNMEVDAYNLYKGIPMAGICRGGQLLNILNGGKMYQDCNNHGRQHELTLLETGERYLVTSTHHQMMRPAEHGKVLATANLSTVRAYGSDLSKEREMLIEKGPHEDVEIVLYGKELCFQPHPEYNIPSCTELFFRLLSEKLGC